MATQQHLNLSGNPLKDFGSEASFLNQFNAKVSENIRYHSSEQGIGNNDKSPT